MRTGPATLLPDAARHAAQRPQEFHALGPRWRCPRPSSSDVPTASNTRSDARARSSSAAACGRRSHATRREQPTSKNSAVIVPYPANAEAISRCHPRDVAGSWNPPSTSAHRTRNEYLARDQATTRRHGGDVLPPVVDGHLRPQRACPPTDHSHADTERRCRTGGERLQLRRDRDGEDLSPPARRPGS